MLRYVLRVARVYRNLSLLIVARRSYRVNRLNKSIYYPSRYILGYPINNLIGFSTIFIYLKSLKTRRRYYI